MWVCTRWFSTVHQRWKIDHYNDHIACTMNNSPKFLYIVGWYNEFQFIIRLVNKYMRYRVTESTAYFIPDGSIAKWRAYTITSNWITLQFSQTLNSTKIIIKFTHNIFIIHDCNCAFCTEPRKESWWWTGHKIMFNLFNGWSHLIATKLLGSGISKLLLQDDAHTYYHLLLCYFYM